MSFSRLQLAAALIEYDNEDKSPYERKDAKQSAIFNTKRQTRPTNAYATSSKVYGMEATNDRPPSHVGTSQQSIGRQSLMSMGSNYDRMQTGHGRRDTRMTIGSNFGKDEDMIEDLEQEEPHGEVDLASWGIPDAFLEKRPLDKRDSRSVGRLASPRSPPYRTQSVRAMSMVGTEPLKYEPEDLRPLSPSVTNAISSMPTVPPHVDYSDRAVVPRAPALKGDKSKRNRTVSFHEFSAPQDDEHGIDPEPMEIIRPGSSMSVLSRGRYEHPAFPPASPIRTSGRMSSASSSYPTNVPLPASPASALEAPESIYLNTPGEEIANPFSLPAPAGNRVSRFDPKIAAHQRTSSRGSVMPDRPDSRATGYFGAEPDPSDSQSRYDQPGSPASLRGSQMHSRMRLLRPKTLLMPTPLQGQLDPSDSAPQDGIDKRGFMIGRRPLPPGSVRPNSLLGSLPASKSGNVRLATQRIFADSLAVGGSRGEYFVGGAEADGEVAFHQLGGQALEENEEHTDKVAAQPGTEDWRPVRPVTGLSLMDKLEEKKAAQMAKRRVFTGDSRPTMMSRDDGSHRTLVDLANPDTQSNVASKRKTLLGHGGDDLAIGSSTRPGNDRHRSVFGVDQVWQREMAKMRREEEAERAADEQANGKRPPALPTAQDFELDGAPSHFYGDGQDEDLHNMPLLDESPRASTPLPVLPPISGANDTSARRSQSVDIDDWGASDDENPKPTRRNKKKRISQRMPVQAQTDDAGSSDEDVPLTKAFNIAKRPTARDDDQSSSEDEPLAKLVAKNKPPVLPTMQAVSAPADDEDEEDDDVPLAVRRMTMMNLQSGPGSKLDEDDDDIPLAQKHLSAAQAQQQRQSAMFPNHQQQPQQHQQMLYQQAMFANPMAGGFGMPHMGMPMMGMPMMSPYMSMNPSMMSIPQLQPPPDPAIDRWRREVEGKEGSVISSVRSGRT